MKDWTERERFAIWVVVWKRGLFQILFWKETTYYFWKWGGTAVYFKKTEQDVKKTEQDAYDVCMDPGKQGEEMDFTVLPFQEEWHTHQAYMGEGPRAGK